MSTVTFRELKAGDDDATGRMLLQFNVREPLSGNCGEALKSSSSNLTPDPSFEARETTGLHSWPSSLLLGSYMIGMGHRGELRNMSIVELGAGTGIAGLCAVLSDLSSTLILTDGDENVIHNLQKTLMDLNSCPPFARHSSSDSTHLSKCSSSADQTEDDGHMLISRVQVNLLEWGPLLYQLQDCNADIVIGADCLYEREQWDDFLATVYCLLVGPRDSSEDSSGRAPKRRKFIGCHHLRNSSHTIAPYLEHWGLQARELTAPNIFGCINNGIRMQGSSSSDTLGLFELTLIV